MKIKEFFIKITQDSAFRWYFFAVASFLISFAFLIYNFAVGVAFRLVWNFSVSFYYLLLIVIKGIIIFNENKWKGCEKVQLQKNRLKLFKIENVFLLLIDFVLILPIALLVLQRKHTVSMGMIPTITVAAYTTYNVIMASINYIKTKKSGNLSLHGLKVISLKEALVSIITLQNTMIVEFGDATNMLTLTTWTSGGMLALMIAISIVQVVKLYKMQKNN